VRALVVIVVVAAVLGVGARFAPERTQDFARGTATITTGGTPLVLRVERARTPAQRAQGLMGRRSLPPRAGMTFEYESPSTGAFWMKNTLIPLDIAFYDGRGRILRILTMQPCRVAACPLYDPKVSYRGALEVNAGSFRRWGVGRGDRIVVRAR